MDEGVYLSLTQELAVPSDVETPKTCGSRSPDRHWRAGAIAAGRLVPSLPGAGRSNRQSQPGLRAFA